MNNNFCSRWIVFFFFIVSGGKIGACFEAESCLFIWKEREAICDWPLGLYTIIGQPD